MKVPTHRRRRSLASLFLVALAACGDTGGDALREGAVVIDDWDNPVPGPAGVSVSDVSSQGTATVVVHSRSSGGTIVEHPDASCPGCPGTGYMTEGLGESFVSVSEDGVTWNRFSPRVPWKYIEGLFQASDGMYAIGSTASQGAGGFLYYYYQLRRLDAAWSAVTDPDVDSAILGAMLKPVAVDRYSGLARIVDPRPGVIETDWNIDYHYFDKTHLRVFSAPFRVAMQPCNPANYETRDGVTFVGYCQAKTDFCRIEISVASMSSTSQCTPKTGWPQVLLDLHNYPLTRLGGVVIPYTQDEDGAPAVAAMLVSGESAPRTWTLPGPLDTPNDGMRPTYANLLRLFDGRFVRLKSDGSYDIYSFARSPCADDDSCPMARIAWIQFLGDDRWLVFYALENGTRHRLIALAQTPGIEVVARDPSWPETPDPVTPTEGPQGSLPAGPGDRFCMLVHRCDGVSWQDCHWAIGSDMYADVPGKQAIVDAKTCEDVRAIWPALSMVGQPCTATFDPAGWGCQDGLMAHCTDNQIAFAYERCDAITGTQVCSPQRSCPKYPDGCPSACQDDTIVYTCADFESRFDCSFVGQKCVNSPIGAVCQPRKSSEVLCQAFRPACDGAHFLFCRDAGLMSIDCTTLGATTCAARDGAAYCEWGS